MAIYHFSAQVASRSAGKSAVAMAAYRSGDRLEDERTGESKFYRRDVQPETMILAPAQSPVWVQHREQLWNEVEKAEKRKDAQLCREINVALPKEFSARLQMEEVKDFCRRQFVHRGMVADIAIHRDDRNNPHAHIMLTTREIGPEGFGKKIREWNDRELLGHWREQWAEQVNQVFERNNRPERIDHRSFEQQGISDRLPTIHEGPTVWEMEQRGVLTDRGSINRSVREHNSMVIDLQTYAKEREKIKTEMARTIPTEPKSMKQIDEEHGRLYWEHHHMKADITELEGQLERIGKIQVLQEERDTLRKKQEDLRPRTIWQGITKPNQQQIDVLERNIQQKEKLIQIEQRDTRPVSDAPTLQSQLSLLLGTFKAVDRAFQEISRERTQMQQEAFKQRMRDQAKYRRQDRDQGWER